MPHQSDAKMCVLLAILAVTLPECMIAQARVLKVISSDSQPVVYANVAVEGGETRITDEKGEVSLGAGKRQTFTVRVMRIGFKPWFGKLDLSDTPAVFIITLPALAQALAPVTVTGEATIKSPLQLAGFYDRWMMRQKGALSAVFIGPEEIEFRHPDRITNLLRGLNGVCLARWRGSAHLFAFANHPGSIPGASSPPGSRAAPTAAPNGGSCPFCPMAIVIDGMQQTPTPAIDNVLDANDVMAIEVYDRGGNMPISMQFDDTNCGVIALWTGSRK